MPSDHDPAVLTTSRLTTFDEKPMMMGRRRRSIAIGSCQLEGDLLISRNTFPYFMLMALEGGGPLRALVLLLISPLLFCLEFVGLENVALRGMILVSLGGLRVSDVKAVSKATLPRFFMEDLRRESHAYSLLRSMASRCVTAGKKDLVVISTRIPRIMVEPFLREYLDVLDHHVIIGGTELRMFGGYCTGGSIIGGIGTNDHDVQAVLLEGMRSSSAQLLLLLLLLQGDDGTATAGMIIKEIDVGVHGESGPPFMKLCREEAKLVSSRSEEIENNKVAAAMVEVETRSREYPKPVIFHDGRLVGRPTAWECLSLLLWLPLSILLAIFRILAGVLLPYKLIPMAIAAIGVRIRAQFPTTPPPPPPQNDRRGGGGGSLYVCCHRTLLDPVFITTALQRKVRAVTYSLSRFSEVISPIPTVRLSRERSKDDAAMRSLLRNGDLVVCPEGTTCREPYLLRFSPLFAEIVNTAQKLEDNTIVPVAVDAEGSMFYGSSVRGYKCLDSLFFLMNPIPSYRMVFLQYRRPNKSSSTSYEVANEIQQCIGRVLGFQCTNLTRKDKYRILAGNDGHVR